MALRNKHIHLLFVLSLSLHSLPIMGGEFMYDTVPVAKDVVEAGRDISTIFADNQAYIIAPVVVALLGGSLFYAQKKFNIYPVCASKCASFQNGLNNKCVDVQNFCVSCTSECVDMVFPQVLSVPIKNFFEYFFKGFTNYAANNKTVVAGALLLHVAGRVVLPNAVCNVGIPSILMVGYCKSMSDKLDVIQITTNEIKERQRGHIITTNKIKEKQDELIETVGTVDKKVDGLVVTVDTVDKKVDRLGADTAVIKAAMPILAMGLATVKAEMKDGNNLLAAQAEKNKQELIDDVQKLSCHLGQVQSEIKKAFIQSQQVGDNVQAIEGKFQDLSCAVESGNIEVNKKLVSLSTQLDGMADEFLSVAKKVDALSEENSVIREDFKKACQELASTQDALASLSVTLVGQMTELTKTTNEKLKKFTTRTQRQLEDIQTTVSDQGRDVKDVKEDVKSIENNLGELVNKVEQGNLLIYALDKIGSEHHQRLISLDSAVKDVAQENQEQFKVMQTIFGQYEKNLNKLTECVSSLTEEQRSFKSSWFDFLTKMTFLESAVDEIKRDNNKKALEIQMLHELYAKSEKDRVNRDKRAEEKAAASDELIKSLREDLARTARVFDKKQEEVLKEVRESNLILRNFQQQALESSLRSKQSQQRQRSRLSGGNSEKNLKFNLPSSAQVDFQQLAFEAEEKLNE